MNKHTLAPIHIHPLLEIHCMIKLDDAPHLTRCISHTSRNWPIDELFNNGLIEHSDPKPGCIPYKCTQKGQAWIEAMELTPMPTQRWVVE